MAGEAGPDRGHGWSATDLARLATIFETFVPGSETDAARRAGLVAETLDAAADHAELRLLRVALRSLEWPPANALTARVWGRFSRLDRPRREALLLAWSTSPIARLRTTYQVLKRLAMFAAYADEGTGAAPENSLWREIGYEPPAVVATPEQTLALESVDRDAAGVLELEADVIVVGSGAGGGVVAARVAAAGHSVLVLEQGPSTSEESLPRTEGNAFRRLYLDQGTTSTADLGIAILAGSAVGGATTINWMTSLEPPDWLRAEWADVHGLTGFDNAETDDDLARLRRELDLRPPSIIPPKDQLILDGAAALGWEAAPTERNAGPCTACGGCGFGCRSGSKRSGPRSHLGAAVAAGARVVAGAQVERITFARGFAEGVEGRLLPEDGAAGAGRGFRARGRAVVVSAGALRTPLLLQQSGIQHPALGRYLRLHPVVAVAARMESPVEMWIGPTQAARSLHHLHGDRRDTGNGFVIESAPAHPGLIASALPWEGGDAQAALMRDIGRYAPLIGIIHERGFGSVGRSRGGHPRISYRLGDEDAAMARVALVALARLARAGGAQRIVALATPAFTWDAHEEPDAFDRFIDRLSAAPTAPNRITLFSAHQMGTARAGVDAGTHACDPVGRVRQGSDVVGGLHVADASLFPTSSGVNPMLTVMALAERSARAVLQDLAGT